MTRTILSRLIARGATAALLSLAALSAQAVTIPTVPIGNHGNAGDSRIMTDGTTGYGSVGYGYHVGKTEVTNAQYVEFLNAVAATDTYGLYSILMNLDSRGGITRTGASGSYSYSVKASAVGAGPGGTDYAYANKPVVFVSWGDATRFANWLHNGQPVGAQNASSTEDGAYTLNGATSEAALMAVARNSAATWVLTSEDEWHKAAYYDASTGNYHNYPTSSNVVPNNDLPSADTGNSANYWDGNFTTGTSEFPITDVGAYTLSASPSGTFDQGGNVAEWTEAIIDDVRTLRGGPWGGGAFQLSASFRSSYLSPLSESHNYGFRVANVPEPSSYLLGAFALASLLALGRKRCR